MEYKLDEQGVSVSYYPGTTKNAVVFCSGLPQYPSQYHPFVKTLQNLGVHLFIPKYAGTWESNGEFSVAQSTRDIETAIGMVRKGSSIELFNNTLIHWDIEHISVIGFSYGALPALLSNQDVHRTVLIAPFVNWNLYQKNNPGELQKTIEFLGRAYQNVYRINAAKFFEELGVVQYPPQKDNLVMVTGNGDDSMSFDEAEWLRNTYAADHLKFDGGHTSNLPEELYKKLLLE